MKAKTFLGTNRHLSVRLTSILVAAVFVMGTVFVPTGSYAAETDAADAGAKAEVTAGAEADVTEAADPAEAEPAAEDLQDPETDAADAQMPETTAAEEEPAAETADLTEIEEDAEKEIDALEDLLVVTDENGDAIELKDLDEADYDGFIYKIKEDAANTEIREKRNMTALM